MQVERQGWRVHEVQRRDGGAERAAARGVVRDLDGSAVGAAEGRLPEAGEHPARQVQETGEEGMRRIVAAAADIILVVKVCPVAHGCFTGVHT